MKDMGFIDAGRGRDEWRDLQASYKLVQSACNPLFSLA
jgi:hypothetical protein